MGTLAKTAASIAKRGKWNIDNTLLK